MEITPQTEQFLNSCLRSIIKHEDKGLTFDHPGTTRFEVIEGKALFGTAGEDSDLWTWAPLADEVKHELIVKGFIYKDDRNLSYQITHEGCVHMIEMIEQRTKNIR